MECLLEGRAFPRCPYFIFAKPSELGAMDPKLQQRTLRLRVLRLPSWRAAELRINPSTRALILGEMLPPSQGTWAISAQKCINAWWMHPSPLKSLPYPPPRRAGASLLPLYIR